MRVDPIHKNLNTSFVDVGNLVTHLNGLQFVGRITIEYSSYEADIVFRSGRQVHAREFDHILGRLRDGKEALRSILEKAKEPNGRIGVCIEDESPKLALKLERVFVDEAIVSGAREMAYGFCDTNASSVFEDDILDLGHPARDREEFKELILELLKNAEIAFENKNLNFELLFRNACFIASDRFPFVHPDEPQIEFTDGRLYVSDKISLDQLSNAISAVLGHILFQIRKSSELEQLFDHTTNRMRAVLARRRTLLDRMLLRRQFEKLVDY